MNQKKAKSLRRMARIIARERGDTVPGYRTITWGERLVQVGWKERDDQPEQAPTIVQKAGGFLRGMVSAATNWLKKMAGVENETPAAKPAPKEFVPDIRKVVCSTDVVASGMRYYLQRLKRMFRDRRAFIKQPNGDLFTTEQHQRMLQNQVRAERAEHLRSLAVAQA